ncbi:hypothetical protein RHSIM_Rhsim11G0006100 [Rhododendron simsii]|uniref:Uncharacterized protein n=1 Tax=Rhododendron simsii TaxID=118357 RepID=A0A834L9W2_RHOSS|nr:hypothetical protein RHSIM_Rhsim11G0006100 [Rhododendron simsii]
MCSPRPPPSRYQVNGWSYADKISDGFYNILGMNPYLWVMCNDSEEDHQSSCLVIIEDDRNFARVHITLEYEACMGFNMGKNSDEIRKILGHSIAVDNIHETMAVEVEY